jgi:signal transduction histidine kinase
VVRSMSSSYWAACGVLIAALVVAIGAAGWIGGWRAAAPVTLVGFVTAQYVLLAPRGEFDVSPERDFITLVAYVLISLAIVGFGRAWEMRLRAAEQDIGRLMLDRFREVEAIRIELASRTAAAAAADATKNEFLANIRHELRTPLSSIIGFTSLLLESPVNEEQRRQLDFANAAARQLLEQLDAIIEYSDLAAGRVGLAHEEFAVGGVLAEAHATVATAASAKGLELTMLDMTHGLRVLGDRARLRRAITELAGNAIKFTSRGRVRLVATSATGAGDEVELRFVVEDTGIGLAPDSLEAVFQPFRSAHESVARRHGGIGLGLASSRQIAMLMGGDVTVQSRPGEGSTFRLTAWVRRVD